MMTMMTMLTIHISRRRAMEKLILITMLILNVYHTERRLSSTLMIVEGRSPTPHTPKLHPWSHSYQPWSKLSQRIQKQVVSRRIQQTNKKFQSTCINAQNQRYVICQTRFTFRFPTQSFVQEVVFGKRRKMSSTDSLKKSHVSISSMQRMELV